MDEHRTSPWIAAAVAAAVALLIVAVVALARPAVARRAQPATSSAEPTLSASALAPSSAPTSQTGSTSAATRDVTRSGATSVPVDASPSTVDLSFDVPWVDRPGSSPDPPVPLPGPLRPVVAPLCRADQLTVTAQPSQYSQDDGVVLDFRNSSSSACLLSGRPSIDAEAADLAPTHLPTAGRPPMWDIASWDMAPGDATQVWVQSSRACDPTGDGSLDPRSRFTRLVVTLPGGGTRDVRHLSIHQTCSLASSYGRPKPEDRYAPDLRAQLTAALTLPSTVQAGAPFTYVARLTNPTTHPIALDPCPVYLAGGGRSGVSFSKNVDELNCDAVRAIPPGATVRYEMRDTVPADAASGPMSVWWQALLPLGDKDTASATGTTQVLGNDTPCQATRLAAAAPDKATVFSGTGLYDSKDAGTALTVVVTNTGSAPCTLQGAPTVAMTAADGRDPAVRFVDAGQRFPRPPEPQVPLVPGGTATVTLAWHSQWCSANPNPVTVHLGLPANGGTLSVVPAHGWTPPACNGFEWNTISADPFQR